MLKLLIRNLRLNLHMVSHGQESHTKDFSSDSVSDPINFGEFLSFKVSKICLGFLHQSGCGLPYSPDKVVENLRVANFLRD